MKRIAYVMQMQGGHEGEAREAQTNMPTDELKGLGIQSVESFIGSGYYILVLECEETDFQATMERFFKTPSVQGFLDKLRPFVQGLPQRGEAYAAADAKHSGAQATQSQMATSTVSSAQLPLAASAYHWSASGGTTNTGLGGNGGSMSGGTRGPER